MDREGKGESGGCDRRGEDKGVVVVVRTRGPKLGNPSRFGLGPRILAEVLRAATCFSSTA